MHEAARDRVCGHDRPKGIVLVFGYSEEVDKEPSFLVRRQGHFHRQLLAMPDRDPVRHRARFFGGDEALFLEGKRHHRGIFDGLATRQDPVAP